MSTDASFRCGAGATMVIVAPNSCIDIGKHDTLKMNSIKDVKDHNKIRMNYVNRIKLSQGQIIYLHG